MPSEPQPQRPRHPWYGHLYLQVLIAVAVGIGVGCLWPSFGKSLQPLGDGFIKLIKMVIAPIIFCTVVHGIASMRDMKKLGRVGGKTLLYFEVISTLALIIGLIVVNTLKPGVGFNATPEQLAELAKHAPSVDPYLQKAKDLSTVEFFLNIIPATVFSAFATGDLLQVLFVSLLAGFAITFMGEAGRPILRGLEMVQHVFFGIMRIVVKVAPLGAFGAMAYTVGAFGAGSLQRLGLLMLGFYLTAILFIVVVLGSIAKLSGFSIFRFLAYIKDELLLVLGTSSSETALPGMIQKMRRLGCAESTVGLVIPAGYSFNLDGTNIYLSMAAVFLAQATNTPLDLPHQISLLLIAMLTSKGASGVTGAGFITLAATLSVVPGIPPTSLVLLTGIDRFMSECRSLTNLIGNGVATVAISRWEGELTAETLRENMDPKNTPEAV